VWRSGGEDRDRNRERENGEGSVQYHSHLLRTFSQVKNILHKTYTLHILTYTPVPFFFLTSPAHSATFTALPPLLTTPELTHAQPNSLQLPHILGHIHKLWYTKAPANSQQTRSRYKFLASSREIHRPCFRHAARARPNPPPGLRGRREARNISGTAKKQTCQTVSVTVSFGCSHDGLFWQ
jgi:hypothetical protein